MTLIAMLLPMMGMAAEVEPEVWEVRSFTMPQRFLEELQVSETKSYEEAMEKWRLIDLPGNDAPEERWVEVLKDHSKKLKKLIGGDAEIFPEGSVLVYDLNSETLAMRTTKEAMQWGENLEERVYKQIPELLAFRVDVVECDAGKVRKVVEDAAKTREHGEIWKRVMVWVGNEQAVIKATARTEAKSGQRAVAEAGKEMRQVSEVLVNDAGQVELRESERKIGLRMELEVVLGPDRRTVDVNHVFSYDFGLPEWGKEVLFTKPGTQGIEVPVMNRKSVFIETSEAFLDGDVQLVGVWTLPDKPGTMQAAFMHCKVVPLYAREVNEGLAEVLKKYADRVEEIEPQKVTIKLPEREFWVPPDLLDGGVAADAPADPFAAGAYGKQGRKILTPRRALEKLGIPFPDGSAVLFSRKIGRLWVRNTEENLVSIEALVDSIRWRGPPSVLSGTVQVIQAEEKWVRELASRADESGDHRKLWKEVKQGIEAGKIVALEAIRLGCRSGQRAKFQAGVVYNEFAPLSFRKNEEEAGKKSEFKKPDEVGFQQRMVSKLDERPAGLTFEMEPLLGPDGYTIELLYSMKYHFAAPIQNEANSAKREFFAAEMTTTSTFATGYDRLIGVWEPKDAGADGAKVLQAAFLRVDYVQDIPEFMRESPSPHDHEHR